jgi:hypothetical protein
MMMITIMIMMLMTVVMIVMLMRNEDDAIGTALYMLYLLNSNIMTAVLFPLV